MASAIKKKITPKDMNPKRLLGTSEETRSMALGVVLGMANDVTTRNNDQGEIMEGLVGQFGYKDNDGKTVLRSYVLWLPGGMGGDLIEGAKKAKAGEAAPVEFAFTMGVVKADNPAGYEWTMTPLIEATEADPLAALEAKVAGALPSPEKVKAK